MQRFSKSPVSMLSIVWNNRSLFKALLYRDIVGRYKGSVLGILWSIITPLVMLAVYTFVFSTVFQSRWQEGSDSRVEFSLVLFCGLIIFNIFSESVNRASNIVVENVNYVKKVVFPLEILPLIIVGSAVFNAISSFIILLLAYWIVVDTPSYTVLYAPIVVIPFLFVILGLCWFLASLGIFLRDIGQFVSILTLLTLFMSPIFYPARLIPAEYQGIMILNPLLPIIEQFRNVMYWQKEPDFYLLSTYFGIAFVFAWLGYCWFQITKRGFADVV